VSLIVIGRCFILAYLVAVGAAFFPVRFSELGWQQQVLDAFVNAGAVPITGRVFILLAIIYKGYDHAGISEDPTLDQYLSGPSRGFFGKRKIARLIRNLQKVIVRSSAFFKIFAPSIVFLVTAILQLIVSTQSFRALDIGLLNQSTLITQQASQARVAIATTADRSVLSQAIQGLVPEQQRDSLLALPPDQQRADLSKRLNERESALRNEIEKQRGQRFASLVVLTVKNILLSLLYAYCLFWLRPAAVRAFIRGAS
jgi:hypothetical protein